MEHARAQRYDMVLEDTDVIRRTTGMISYAIALRVIRCLLRPCSWAQQDFRQWFVEQTDHHKRIWM